MKVINLFAGPGTGKSTTCAALFAELKYRGFNTEMVLEFAKDLVWENRVHHMRIPAFILGTQAYRLHNIVPQVEFAVTDSPILLTLVYDQNPNQKALAKDIFNEFDNLNIFLRRASPESKEYNPNGRLQNYDEAVAKDNEIKQMLADNNIPYVDIPFGRHNISQIIDLMTQRGWIG